MPKPKFATKIEHVVVLMLENRSFDHMLGFLKKELPGIYGLTGNESNLTANGKKVYAHSLPDDSPDLYVTKTDPDHEFDEVTRQLHGILEPSPDATANMSGFVRSYQASKQVSEEEAGAVMAAFLPDQVPILSQLARHYILCDHWFASVPGSTWPNRFFIHCGTSSGELGTPSGADLVDKWAQFRAHERRTIYEDLMDAGYSWAVYHHGFPQVLMATRLRQLDQHEDLFPAFERFQVDINAGKLPNYSFIEPNHLQAFGPPSDQHPPFDVRAGEKLIAEVYNALRRSGIWDKCLLVVLYDEHGGFHDHVAPPPAVRPDQDASSDPSFTFDRLGVRVPSVVISPYAPALVTHTVYDHTSLLATVRNLFPDLGAPLSQREEKANTFDGKLDFTRKPDSSLPAFGEGVLEKFQSVSPATSTDPTDYAASILDLAKAVAKHEKHPLACKFIDMFERAAGI